MSTKEEIMAQIQIFKNAKGTLVQDSLVKILETLCENIATESYVSEQLNDRFGNFTRTSLEHLAQGYDNLNNRVTALENP